MDRLTSKVALITGGAGGIGTGIATRFAAEGATVVVADVLKDRAEAVAASIGNGSIGLYYDAGNPDSIEAGIGEVARRFDRIDVLINNAAAVGFDVMSQDTTAPAIPVEIWDLVMDVNVRGVMLGCKYAIPHMIRNGGGTIINTASVAALAGDNVRIAYGTSKAAVVGLTRYVAAQHGRQGIRCNAILPGPIMIPSYADYPDMVEMIVPHLLTPRLGVPADIAGMAAFLASDDAAYVTGQAYAVDGGLSAHQPQMADMRPFEAPESDPANPVHAA